MRRPPRRFVAECAPLEPRALLAAGHAPIRPNGVSFGVSWGSSLVGQPGPLAHVVGQDDGFATVVLTRSSNLGVSQVRVVTDPASPGVGVNLPPVNQLVTFPNYVSEAIVTIPITAGAPNSGEVDVNLALVPISPRLSVDGPTQLRILASNDEIVPEIVSVEGKTRSIVLRFNKAMDPVAASDVNNYRATWKAWHGRHNALGPLALLNGNWWNDQSTEEGTVPIRSARYVAATHSVVLTASRPIQYDRATGGITVSQARRANGATPPAGLATPPTVLTDAQGLPMGSGYSLPGRFVVYALPGLHPAH